MLEINRRAYGVQRVESPVSLFTDQEELQTMNQIKLIVHRLLEEQPALRDNDNLLMSTIWKQQSNILNFFHRFESGRLHSPESIRRTRQKIQEDYPHLRGELYEARQKHQVKVKEELGYKI